MFNSVFPSDARVGERWENDSIGNYAKENMFILIQGTFIDLEEEK